MQLWAKILKLENRPSDIHIGLFTRAFKIHYVYIHLTAPTENVVTQSLHLSILWWRMQNTSKLHEHNRYEWKMHKLSVLLWFTFGMLVDLVENMGIHFAARNFLWKPLQFEVLTEIRINSFGEWSILNFIHIVLI